MTRSFSAIPRRYRFGPYVLDSATGLLWREGVLVPLTPKTVDVLCVLVEHRGEVVEKSDLMNFVWPNTFVEENNLARQISILRKTLHQRRGQHDFISTIPGHGYMFVADVVELDADVGNEAEAAGESQVGVLSADTAAVPAPVQPADDLATPAMFWNRGWAAVAAVVFLVAAATLAVLMMRIRSGPGRPPIEPRQLTFDGQLQRDPAWSPDGGSFVYANDRAGNLDLYRRSTTDPAPLRLTNDPADESQPDWSPDGRWLAFRSDKDGGGIYVMAAEGGPARRVSDVGFYPRWSPDGSKILLADSTPVGIRGFRLVTPDGREMQWVRPDVVSKFQSASAAWHPDGRRISIAGRATGSVWSFVTAALQGTDVRTSSVPADVVKWLSGKNNRLGRLVWSRSGRQLYFDGRSEGAHSIWRVSVDEKTLAWSEPERVYTGPGEYGDLALSPDGARLAFTVSNDRTRVWSFPFDPHTGTLTGAGQPLTPGGPAEYDAAAPLDGSKVAFRTVRGNRHEVWERSVTGGGEHLLTASSEWMPTSPRWSRDGTRLAYLRRLSDTRSDAILSVAIHMSNGDERLLPLPAQTVVVPDDWSSDNAWLLAACRRSPGQPMGTCLMPVGTSGASDIRVVASDPTKNLLCQRFSPDERWISFMAVDVQQRNASTIYVMPASGGSWIPVTDGSHYDDKPRWSPDGSAVYFLSARDGALNVWGRWFDRQSGRTVGEPFRVTSFSGTQHTVARDLARVEIAISSNNLFLPITETSGTIWMLDGLSR